jgi:hypothetical protein
VHVFVSRKFNAEVDRSGTPTRRRWTSACDEGSILSDLAKLQPERTALMLLEINLHLNDAVIAAPQRRGTIPGAPSDEGHPQQ